MILYILFSQVEDVLHFYFRGRQSGAWSAEDKKLIGQLVIENVDVFTRPTEQENDVYAVNLVRRNA